MWRVGWWVGGWKEGSYGCIDSRNGVIDRSDRLGGGLAYHGCGE